MSRRMGVTLIELLVVVVLLGIAAALAAPTLMSPQPSRPGLARLIPPARETAARRGEVIYLRISASGEWRMEGATSSDTEPIASGRVEPFPGLPLTLVVSPLGSCAFGTRSAAAARAIPLDPLACELTSS